jgi:hypothetical protein
MVWRDLDITVICPTLESEAAAPIGARLAVHPRVRQVLFRNDTGAWNTDPTYPDGLYLGLKYRTPAGPLRNRAVIRPGHGPHKVSPWRLGWDAELLDDMRARGTASP